jgi:hypothetical protein
LNPAAISKIEGSTSARSDGQRLEAGRR